MKKLLLLILVPLNALCQNTIGLPDVINFNKQTYSAGLQNWDVKQDRNGIVYVANNEGLLSFDGSNWNLYALPNKTIVRSVAIGATKIYVGGQDELGYFSPAKNGLLHYNSLTRFIPVEDKKFGDVWDIVILNNNIFFRSANKIFKFSGETVVTYNAPSEWSYLSWCNGNLYACDKKTGLLIFGNNTWNPLTIKSEMPVNDPVTSILPIHNDSALITTLTHGLFVLSKTGVSKLTCFNNTLFENERIYAATAISEDRIALATSNSGVYIINFKGDIIQKFSIKEGLQNNNVLSIFLDHQRNLWLGLDNGIDLIAYNSAIKKINPLLLGGAGYSAIIYDNRLFAGTSNGLYSVLLQPIKDISFSKGDFMQVNNTKGQTWGLASINNQLLLGKHEGAFVVKDNTAEPISLKPGFWNFVPTSDSLFTTKIIAGNYTGLQFFDYQNGRFTQSGDLKNFNESSRFVAIDAHDNYWVSQPYHGVYKISKKDGGTYAIDTYTKKDGLPSTLNNHVFKIKNEVVFATEQGLFIYNQQKNIFEAASFYNQLLGNLSIRYLKEDMAGNIWFIHEKKLGVIDLSNKEPTVVYLPELNNKLVSGFEFIYPVDEHNIFIGGEKGFYNIDYEKYKKLVQDLQVQIRVVRIISNSDSLLFGGYFKEVNEPQIQQADNIPSISNAFKTLRFEFASSLFAYESNLEYSYRLKGFDDNWSEWTKRTEKEYTNLPAAKFTFEVKVKNNLGKQSAIASYSFKMLPPWYQSVSAMVGYLFLMVAGFYALHKWQQKKFEQQKLKYQEEQAKLSYIHELEINKTASELVTLRNEKLETEVNFKNSELASSAMHLVKKGELFTKIKGELAQVMKGLDNPTAAAELKKMIKALSEDDNMDKEWENFTKHFDKVHGDFVSGLKEKHPAITGNELKLCAYLKMNLSTKEIAQLMNISVRGVEISRYRLRKKLMISSEVSLFDYMLSLQIKT